VGNSGEGVPGAPAGDKFMPMNSHPWSAGFETLPDEHDYRVDEIDGVVPATLRGTLFRNGSGRNDLGGQWFAHWFDGDGMISKIRFDNAGIHYRNRYVATANYRDETAAGRIVNRGFGKMRPYGVLGNAFRQPANVSNTSVVMQGDRLLSLWEGGPPFALDPATLAPATLGAHGIEDFGGVLKAFSAHPKIDPDTGELFNFGIDYGARTTLTPYRLDRGIVTKMPPVVLPYPVMNHDFVLTARYMVFCLGPILLHPLRFVLGFKSFDRALHWEGAKPTLILLVPRDGVGDGQGGPRWIETDAFFQFHFANGFEEDGAVVVDLARYPDYGTIGEALRTYWHSAWPSRGMAALTRLRIDLGTGRVEKQTFATGVANEFPTIHAARTGKRYRYAYFASNPAAREIGPAGYVGEPLFVLTLSGGEDYGIVLVMVFNSADRRISWASMRATWRRDRCSLPAQSIRCPMHWTGLLRRGSFRGRPPKNHHTIAATRQT
jgi:all-trans-8'-apo-beta-carotenal 15,15'-oxygenase